MMWGWMLKGLSLGVTAGAVVAGFGLVVALALGLAAIALVIAGNNL